MKIQEILNELEYLAPPALQESYDNSGLMVGEPGIECTGALLTLDITEAVIEEAAHLGVNLIIAHHPIWFQARKRLNGEDLVSRCILLAIRKNIALYSIHTNLDNVLSGVNQVIAQKLGLKNLKILDPKPALLLKLVVYVPKDYSEKLLNALFQAGAGKIGAYDECAFVSEGIGSFRPSDSAKPFSGTAGVREQAQENRVEVIFQSWLKNRVIAAMYQSHPYEEVAWQLFRTENTLGEYGSGMIGELEHDLPKQEFLALVKEAFKTGGIRYADKQGEFVRKIAVCGGSGSFLIPNALRAKADALLTADISYHKFFDGEGRMMILDIGHFESEQFTPLLIHEVLSKKFTNFALHLSKIRTNPVQYY
jgi:dinuclear metal center YbgI/SA1388 family protein